MTQYSTSRELSEKLYILRFFAIAAVITAHSCFNEIANGIDRYSLGRFARFGVFSFFLVSGFFYKRTNTKEFFGKIFYNLLVPWFFAGSLVRFMVMLITNHQINFDNYFSYMIGNGSTLYFCTMLLIIRMIFHFFAPRDKRRIVIFSICCVAITLVSLMCTSFGLLPEDYQSDLIICQYVNPYLNIFNWIGIYAIGVLFRVYCVFDRIDKDTKLQKFLLVISLLVFSVGYFDKNCSYWSHFGIYTELALFLIIYMGISYFYPLLRRKTFLYIGRNTFPIYLLHYPVLSLLMRVTEFRTSFLAAVIRPFVCIYIIYYCIKLVILLSNKVRWLKFINILFGISE